ncbi:hypothetical protein GJA_4270 [Janthinobacterium agaricidamnosum NBRC 102515 = DSM 9628]|uniref:Uncharacterized protein n=1 Tax=Janthinobacterium agaricidamnosum NBRC 102515 = DSM 9628 TaxID=1349767 RepID=W0VBZ9_9BURK|nr:hypothetical protein GJA_4270 [Janthinobacterium agaricidamnosum NBRC 102515 = DSM 9628]
MALVNAASAEKIVPITLDAMPFPMSSSKRSMNYQATYLVCNPKV